MRWLAAVLLLFTFPQFLNAEEAPNRYESLRQTTKDLWQSVPELSMPTMPTVPWASVPSMPDFALPDLRGEFNAFTQQVSDSLPLLEEMGFEVASFRVQWALSPKARLRLRSSGNVDAAKVAAISAKATGGMLMNALISSAVTAKRIQSGMKLGTAILDVDFAIPPKVRMAFLKPGSDNNQKISERDPEEFALACRDAALND